MTPTMQNYAEEAASMNRNGEVDEPTADDCASDFERQLRRDQEAEVIAASRNGEAQPGPPNPNPWLQLIEDGADLMTRELPPIVEIVKGIVTEQSKFIIGSSAKSNKTWISIDLALSIAHGVPWWGHETIQSPILYANFELKPETFARRVQILTEAKGIKIERDSFLHLPLRGRIGRASVIQTVDRIIEMAVSRKRKIIFCDPVYKMNTEGEENNSRDQTLFFNQLDRITTEAGCTLILDDHFSKGNQSEKDPLDAIRGSSAKGGDVDAAMILRRHDTDDCFRVDVIHRELPPVHPFCVGWHFPLMELRADLDPENMKKPSGGRPKNCDPRKYLLSIADTDSKNAVSISGWAARAEVTRQTLQGNLPDFRQKGWIATAGEGNNARQYLTIKGQMAIKDYKEATCRK